MARPVVELKGYGYAYPGTEAPVLRKIDLRIGAGECHLLTGATGSGKTTLAQALKGTLGPGRQAGSIRLRTDAAGAAPTIGLVLQNPETQLFASCVGEEVAFALENRGVAPGEMAGKVRAALRAVGLDVPLEAPVPTLSMGQKYRVLIAAVLVMEPALLILDEPTAQLDARGLGELRRILEGLLRKGTALLLLEHRAQAFHGLVDCQWQLDGQGRLRPEVKAPAASSPHGQGAEPVGCPPSDQAGAVVRAENLAAGTGSGGALWLGASFALGAGQRVLVQGPNGAGKTTLLRLLAGMDAPCEGKLKVLGQKPSLKTLRGRIGFLFQNPQRQLFEDRVIDEVAFTLKRRGVSGEERRIRVEGTLRRCGILDLSHRSPHQLSFGQKHLVALASILVADPELLLLDDPFAGLDRHCRQAVWKALMDWRENSTKTVVWTSHHEGESPVTADVLLTVTGGKIACRPMRP